MISVNRAFNKLFTVAAVILAFTAGAASAQTPPRPKTELWFSPNMAADNPAQPILSPNRQAWAETYEGMSVFSLYLVDLDFKFASQAARDQLSAMKADGKKISVEVGGMDMSLCNPADAYRRTTLNWDSVALRPINPGHEAFKYESAKIARTIEQRADYIIMDGPFERAFDNANNSVILSGCPKGFTYEFIAQQLVLYMQYMKSSFPNAKFLLSTSFPHWQFTAPDSTFTASITGSGDLMKTGTGQILNYRDVLNGIVPMAQAGGVPLTGLVVDNPYNYMVRQVVNSAATAELASEATREQRWARLKGLVEQAKSKGLKTYVFTNFEAFPEKTTSTASDNASRSQDFFTQSITYSGELTARDVQLDGHIVASWYNKPNQWVIHKDTAASFSTVPSALLPVSGGATFAGTAHNVMLNLRAYNEPIFGINGYIDGLAGPGNSHLVGWACSKYASSSIYVHLYTGEADGSKRFRGFSLANIASEPGVAAACKTSYSNHRFAIPIPSELNGLPLYVYALPAGLGQNKLLTNSGVFVKR